MLHLCLGLALLWAPVQSQWWNFWAAATTTTRPPPLNSTPAPTAALVLEQAGSGDTEKDMPTLESTAVPVQDQEPEPGLQAKKRPLKLWKKSGESGIGEEEEQGGLEDEEMEEDEEITEDW